MRPNLFMLAIAILSAGGCLGFQPQEDAPKYRVSPKTMARGKTYGIVVRRNAAPAGGEEPFAGVHVRALQPVGFEITEEKISADGTFLLAKLAVAGDAPLNEQELVLVRSSDSDAEQVLGSASFMVVQKEGGPIPPGLTPQVDITWKVLPRPSTSDSFGGRIVKRYFAVEVVVGNNSGYDLQIASLGFRPKGADFDSPIPTDSYNIVRGSLEREQQSGKRAILVNSIRGLGPLLTAGASFITHVPTQNTYSTAVSMFSNPFEKGLELVYPDKTVRQLIGLDTRSVRDSVVVPNNLSQRLLIFISRSMVECPSDDQCTPSPNGMARFRRTKNYDPNQVMNALGQLVLVGKTVDYLQRVRVVSEPEPTVVPPPTVLPNDQLFVEQGAQSTLELSGNALAGATIRFEPGSPLERVTSSADGSGRRISVTVKAGQDGDPRRYRMYVDTNGGSTFTEVEIRAVAPKATVLENTAQANQVDVTPVSHTLKLGGTYLTKTSITGVTGLEPGTVAPDGSGLTIPIRVGPEVRPGSHELKITRFGQSQTIPFTVVAQKPVVTEPKEIPVKATEASSTVTVKGSFLRFATPQIQGTQKIAATLNRSDAGEYSLVLKLTNPDVKEYRLTFVNGSTTSEPITIKVTN